MLVFLSLALPVFSQDWQNRDIVHIQADVSKSVFLSGWSISNFRTQTLNNTNLLGGVGVRGQEWWLESMVQRQWNSKAGQWLLDFRFDRQSGPWHMYAEGSPFLTKHAFYDFVIVDRKARKGFSIGAETENIYQPGSAVIAMGPRVSRQVVRLWDGNISFTAALRFSPVGGYIEPRLYLVFNRRISFADRK